MSNLIPSFGSTFNNDIDDLFHNLLDYRPAFSLRRGNAEVSRTTPRANVSRSDEGYIIELASPGFSRDDFQVNVENGTLTVTGTAYESAEEPQDSYTTREFTCTSFNRSWSLPDGVNVENLSASYEAGILNINIPVKDGQKKKHTIAID
jgi:HSP20 family protein